MSESLHSELSLNHQDFNNVSLDNDRMPSNSTIKFLLDYSKSVQVKSTDETGDIVVHLN